MPSIRFVDLDGKDIVMVRPQTPRQGDPIACTSFDLGWPEHRESMHERAGYSGSIDLTNFHGPRILTFDLRLLDSTAYNKEDTLDLLHDISAPNNTFYVYARRDNWPTERRMKCRATALSCVSDRVSASRFVVSLSYVCPTGEMEGAELSTVPINPPITPAGLTIPINWGSTGIAFASGRSGSAVPVINRGNTEAPVIMTLTGRCDNPSIINRTSGKQLTFKDMSLATGETMTINTDTGAVTVGGSSYYSKIDWTYSSWWGLVKGENVIELVATNLDQNCQLVVYYRDRWV